MTTIALLGTMDTKGQEYGWVRDRLHQLGDRTVVIDCGIFPPSIPVDIAASEVAAAADMTVAGLQEVGDRGAAMQAMTTGAGLLLRELQDRGEIDGVLALGGSGGSAVAGGAMQHLPVGFPKVLVSTMASGDVSPYVGTADITLMYSVVDVAGVNRISRNILGNAAAAVHGMAAGLPADEAHTAEDRPLIAATMFGVTTTGVTHARERLEALGYEVVVFHATGSGGRAMERLVRQGFFEGVLDLTTTELADELVGGVLSAGPDRLEAAGETGTPQVVSLGALDMVNFGPFDTVPAAFADRRLYVHNQTITLMRTTPDESSQLGGILGGKLTDASGPVTVFIPLGGVSAIDAPGQIFEDTASDNTLFSAVRSALEGSDVRLVESAAHINDHAFGRAAADELHRLISARTAP